MIGEPFLLLYGGSLATLLLATAIVWRWFQPPIDPAIADAGLDVFELAALTGGRQRAAIAAMASLRSSRVTTGPGGTLLADGTPADDASELERELFEAVRRSPWASGTSLVEASASGAAATRIVARLQAAGLLLDARATVLMHVLWACGAVLAGSGALGMVGYLDDHRLVPTLVSPLGAMVAAAAALLWWIHGHRSGASAAGRRLVNAIGDDGEGLSRPGDHSAFEVAMFGSGVLWTQDWALATVLGIAEQDAEGGSLGGAALRFLFDGGESCGCGCG